MLTLPTLRQQLWAVTVFVSCALVVFLWASETTDYFYKIASNDMIDRLIVDNDLQSINSDDDTWRKISIQDEKLTKLSIDIMTNSSGLETATSDENITIDSRTSMNETISPTLQNASIFSINFTSSSRTNPSSQMRSSGRPLRETAPPFRWCYHHQKLDVEIDEELRCELLFEGPEGEFNESYLDAKKHGKEWKPPCEYSDEQIAKMASVDCSRFRRNFNFLDDDVGVPVSQEELSFPLAYVMVIEKWSSQVIRLLSSVYRRHNLYCITYDLHATTAFKKAINETVRCLRSNVIIPDEHLEIYWADISILRATMNCMKALKSRKNHDWKYVQILSYNDFPLKTNLEMVRILRTFNGANDVELAWGQSDRYVRYHKLSELDEKRSNETRPVPPAGMIIYKGSYAATLSRDFVNFLFENKHARDFFEWSVPTWAPEEQFWSTLIHNDHLNAPGRFPGACLEYYKHGSTQKSWISRHQIWYSGCDGMYTSGSCVFGVGELHRLIKRPELVAHKFYADFEPATLYCLSKRHYERTYMEKKSWLYPDVSLNTTYYATLPAVQYQRMVDKERFNCAITYERKSG